jgi:hypothetical protein
MNKTLALTLLLGAAIACDPWIQDCTPKEDMPRRFIGAYWMHGIVSYIQAVYQFATFSAYTSSLTLFGDTMLIASYAIAGANFLGYFPVALIWTLSVVWDDASMYKRYFGWLKASNIYGWLLTATNVTWYVVLVLYIFIFGNYANGATPDFILPIAALSIEGILQILYSIGYGKSRKLMHCWYYEYPMKGYCDWTFEEPEDDNSSTTIVISI